MTTYHYADSDIDALNHVLGNTSLAWSSAVRCIASDGLTTLEYDDKFPFSSGEEVLLDLLGSISGRTSAFAVSDMYKLDEQTRRVAWEAIGIAAGIEGIAHLSPEGRIELITDRKDRDS